MKKNTKLGLVFICFMMLMGCDVKEEDQDKVTIRDDSEEKTTTLYQYFHGIKDYHGGVLTLSDLHEFTYEVNNSGKELDLGLVMFMDGYLQKYQVENGDNSYVNKFTVEGNQKRDVEIKLDQFVVDDTKEHNFHIGSILNPSPIKELIAYKVNHSISQPIGIKVTNEEDDGFMINTDHKEKAFRFETITQDDLKQMEIGSVDDLESNMKIVLSQNGEVIHDYIDPKEKLEVKLTGDYGEFNLYVFVDAKPYKGDEFYFPVESKKGSFSILEIDLPLDIADYKNFFIVLAPKNAKNFIEQSEHFMIGEK